MTPFDVTYAHEFLIEQSVMADASLRAHTAAPTATRIDLAPVLAAAPPAEQFPGFPLVETMAIRAALAVQAQPQPQPRSMLTPSYTEFLLQLLDKDSVITGLVVIAAYIGLIQSL